jgi:ssDNA-binding Zn-finger/Zn-ribbon topoisomerase 1
MIEKSEIRCHVCGDPFIIVPQKEGVKGVMLRCDNVTTCIPHENVYGFGSNEKEAAEIAKQKYKLSR